MFYNNSIEITTICNNFNITPGPYGWHLTQSSNHYKRLVKLDRHPHPCECACMLLSNITNVSMLQKSKHKKSQIYEKQDGRC